MRGTGDARIIGAHQHLGKQGDLLGAFIQNLRHQRPHVQLDVGQVLTRRDDAVGLFDQTLVVERVVMVQHTPGHLGGTDTPAGPRDHLDGFAADAPPQHLVDELDRVLEAVQALHDLGHRDHVGVVARGLETQIGCRLLRLGSQLGMVVVEPRQRTHHEAVALDSRVFGGRVGDDVFVGHFQILAHRHPAGVGRENVAVEKCIFVVPGQGDVLRGAVERGNLVPDGLEQLHRFPEVFAGGDEA